MIYLTQINEIHAWHSNDAWAAARTVKKHQHDNEDGEYSSKLTSAQLNINGLFLFGSENVM